MEGQMRRMETAEMCFLRAVARHRTMCHEHKEGIIEELRITHIKIITKNMIQLDAIFREKKVWRFLTMVRYSL
jgi:hypothetical protein